MKKLLTFFAGVLCSFLGNGCFDSTTAGIPAVTPFDVNSYTGRWYEIARMPNWFERDMTNVCAIYSLEPDGTLKVVNSGLRNGKFHEVTGKAWFVVRPGVGDLRVRFFYPFSGVYKIIKVNENYSLAVVTGADFSSLWILARTPEIKEPELEKILQWVTALGYQTEKLIFTRQKWPEKCE